MWVLSILSGFSVHAADDDVSSVTYNIEHHEGSDPGIDAADPEELGPIPVEHRHGFRVGYLYFENEELRYPHMFVMGYETSQRLDGGAGLDVLFVQNVLVSGLNHSLFLPSSNLLVGASFRDQVEFGVGPNLSMIPEQAEDRGGEGLLGGLSTNMIAAVGLTVPAGRFEVPVHVSWISASDDWGRIGITTGVNWGADR